MKLSWSGVNAFEAGSYLSHYSVSSSKLPLKVHKYAVKTQHELRKVFVVLEHERANRIVVHHFCLPAQHVGHDRSVALEAICLCNTSTKHTTLV
jgi:hypothetical protein